MKGISVVVCTYNGEARLGDTLKSIVQQNTNEFAWELIVVDNASTDNTVEVCTTLLQSAAATFQWQVVDEPKAGLNYARLKGFFSSRYDVLLFCDDDNHLSPLYVQTGFDIMQSNPAIGALGGHGVPVFEGDKPKWFDKYAHSFAVGAQAEKSGRIKGQLAEVYGAGCFFRKAPIQSFLSKGFATVMTDRLGKSLASGGDVEWCYLVQLAGYEVWYDERLQFNHLMPDNRMTWDYYLRLKAAIASGAARLLSYNVLLRNSKATEKDFRRAYIKAKRKAQWQKVKNKLANIVRGKQIPAQILASHILQARANSFINDNDIAFRHFNHLCQMLRKG